MISDYLNRTLPSTEELPCSDDIPVDNEDQNFLPNVLLFLLNYLWADRFDWYFGADMAIYHTTGKNLRVPIVPDGFLSMGVERQKGGKSRRSYATWEENEIVPILTLEMARRNVTVPWMIFLCESIFCYSCFHFKIKYLFAFY